MPTSNSAGGFIPDPILPWFLKFRTDSGSWSEVPNAGRPNRLFANARGDVWEIRRAGGKSEQYFTFGAAVRELAAAGFALPKAAEVLAAAEAAANGQPVSGMASGFFHSRTVSFYDVGSTEFRWTGDKSKISNIGKSAYRTGPSGHGIAAISSFDGIPVSVPAPPPDKPNWLSPLPD